MAKKRAAKKKTTRAKTAKVTCPMCGHCQMMKKPKAKCMSSCKCKGCGKNIKAKDCCVFCDYSNKPGCN